MTTRHAYAVAVSVILAVGMASTGKIVLAGPPGSWVQLHAELLFQYEPQLLPRI